MGELSLCHDPRLVNALVNHPSIRPFIGGEGELDLTGAVENSANWFLLGRYGGFALIFTEPGVREVHTFILPQGRGTWAREAAQEGIDYAWAHGTRVLWSKVPLDADNVVAFASAMGMADTGEVSEQFGKPYAKYQMEAA